MRPFTYHNAETTTQALETASQKNSKYLGGGTNLVDLMKEDVEQPQHLIEVTDINFKTIKNNVNGGISIGAMLSNADTANHPIIRQQYPLLSMAMLSAATAQIRNMATNGGNLLQRTRCPYFYEVSMPCNKRKPGSGCGAKQGVNAVHAIFGHSDSCIAVHPSDMCVALAALKATVEVAIPNGSTRMIPFEDFHRLPGSQPEKDNTLQKGELITHIHLPKTVFADHYYYLKIRERSSYAFALVSVAAGLEIKNNTITHVGLAMGGVAHKPWVLKEAEMFLKGKTPSTTNFERAAKLAMKNAKPLQDNAYKVEMGEKAIVRALQQAFDRKA